MGPGRAVAVAASALAVGCSFAAVGPDPKAPPEVPPVCTRSATGPMAADMTGHVLVNLIVFEAFLSSCRGGDGPGCNPFVAVALGLVASSPFWLAYRHGHKATSACRAAWKRHQAAISPTPAAPAGQPEPIVRDQPPPPECAAKLAAWRRERDRWRKWTLYDRMPTHCQRLADQE